MMFTGKVIFPSYRCFEKSPFSHLSSQFHLPGVKRIRQIPLPIATVATSNSLLHPGCIWTQLKTRIEHCNKSLFPWGRTHDTINSRNPGPVFDLFTLGCNLYWDPWRRDYLFIHIALERLCCVLAFSPILRDGEEAKWGMGRLHQRNRTCWCC
jgi:hypothetical protein